MKMAKNDARVATEVKAKSHWKKGFAFGILLVSATALAQDDMTSQSVVTESDVTQGYLGREVIGIKPQLGTLVFKDSLGNTASRGAAGIAAEVNFLGGS